MPGTAFCTSYLSIPQEEALCPRFTDEETEDKGITIFFATL